MTYIDRCSSELDIVTLHIKLVETAPDIKVDKPISKAL